VAVSDTLIGTLFDGRYQVVRKLGEAGVIVRAGEGLGGPGHIRVTYGTRQENERFLEALGESIA